MKDLFNNKIKYLFVILLSVLAFSFSFVLAQTLNNNSTSTKENSGIKYDISSVRENIQRQSAQRIELYKTFSAPMPAYIFQKDDYVSVNSIIRNAGVSYSGGLALSLIKMNDGAGSERIDRVLLGDYVLKNGDNDFSYKYSIPEFLNDGKYLFEFTFVNTSGREDFSLPLGEINIKNTNKTKINFNINTEDCDMIVNGDDASKYSLSQGIDVAKDETLTVKCQLKNTDGKKSTSSSKDYIISYYNSKKSFGADEINPSDIKYKAININKGVLFFDIDKEEKSQSYDYVFTIYNKNVDKESIKDINNKYRLSSPLRAKYIVSGDNATIQNLSYYKDGKGIKIYFGLSGNVANFPGSRTGLKDTEVLYEYILNKNNKEGINAEEGFVNIKKEDVFNGKIEQKEILLKNVFRNIKKEDRLSLILNVYNKDKSILLDTKTIDVDTQNIVDIDEAPEFVTGISKNDNILDLSKLSGKLYLLLSLVLFLVAVFILNKLYKSKDEEGISIKSKMLLFVLSVVLILGSLFVGYKNVNADKTSTHTFTLDGSNELESLSDNLREAYGYVSTPTPIQIYQSSYLYYFDYIYNERELRPETSLYSNSLDYVTLTLHNRVINSCRQAASDDLIEFNLLEWPSQWFNNCSYFVSSHRFRALLGNSLIGEQIVNQNQSANLYINKNLFSTGATQIQVFFSDMQRHTYPGNINDILNDRTSLYGSNTADPSGNLLPLDTKHIYNINKYVAPPVVCFKILNANIPGNPCSSPSVTPNPTPTPTPEVIPSPTPEVIPCTGATAQYWNPYTSGCTEEMP